MLYVKYTSPGNFFAVLRDSLRRVCLMKFFLFLLQRLLTLLRSTDEWGPLDPQLKLYRKCFNPRTDSKRKNMSYKCVHRCLIDEVVSGHEKCKKKIKCFCSLITFCSVVFPSFVLASVLGRRGRRDVYLSFDWQDYTKQ